MGESGEANIRSGSGPATTAVCRLSGDMVAVSDLLIRQKEGGGGEPLTGIAVRATWDQRPLFKSHVSRLIPLRSCTSGVAIDILRQLPKYFPTADYELPLDPTYEPDAAPKNHPNEEVFGRLQKMRAALLVVPVGEDHMYFAAMNNKACRLTALGRHYWQLGQSGRL